jgi:hypothetical protein
MGARKALAVGAEDYVIEVPEPRLDVREKPERGTVA